MSKDIYCTRCKTHIAEIRDARINKGAKLEGTCAACQKERDVPEFLQGLFAGKK